MVAGSFGASASSQRMIVFQYRSFSAKQAPPVCATLPEPFSRSRLSAGMAMFSRRPFSSRVSRW